MESNKQEHMARKRPYRRKIQCSLCKKEMYNDNFPKHNTNAHRGNATAIDILSPTQKRLQFPVAKKTHPTQDVDPVPSPGASSIQLNETSVSDQSIDPPIIEKSLHQHEHAQKSIDLASTKTRDQGKQLQHREISCDMQAMNVEDSPYPHDQDLDIQETASDGSFCDTISCSGEDDGDASHGLSAEDDDKDDESYIEKITWLTCAGQLENLSKFSHQCQNVLDEAKSENNTDAMKFVVKVKEIALKMSDLSQELVKNCSFAIENIREEELAVGCPIEIDDGDLVSNDPSERPKDLTDNQRKLLIEIGPHQPRLKSFPRNESIPRNKQNKFNASWYDSFPHLEFSQKSEKAYCFVCSLFPSGPGRDKSESAWVDGIQSWHKMKSVGVNQQGKLLKHFSCESHKAALSDFAHFAVESCHIDAQLSRQLKDRLIQEKADEVKNREIMTILFDVARTLARQSLSFRGSGNDENGNFVQLINLVSRHCPTLKEWLESKRLKPYSTKYISAGSQNELVHLLAEDVRSRIKDEIATAGIYSVSADTTPDTSNQDKLVVASRFVANDGVPRERVVEMKECIDKHGKDTAKDVLASLEDNGLDIDGLSFQTYDFAASMSGRIKGAQRCLQDMLDRSVPYIPCQGHRSNTFNEHCCKRSAVVTSMHTGLEDLYVFFSGSCKRHKVFGDATKEVENSLKLRNLSKTRWVYCAQSIDSVWRSYECIPKAIDEVVTADETDMKVKVKGAGIKKKVLSFDFIFGLMFMRIIMTKTKVLTKQLQEEELNILDALRLIDATVENLKEIRNDETAMNAQLDAMVAFAEKQEIDPMSEYQRHHKARRPPKRIDENPATTATLSFQEFYRKEMCLVLDSLIAEYSENIKACLEKIRPLADGLQPPIKKPSKQTVEDICKLFPPAHSIEAEVLMAELEIFTTMIRSESPKSSRAAAIFAHENQVVFPTVCRAYQLLLTAPVSVAKDERTFSKLKIVKNCLRSTMRDERLNDLIVLACEKDLTDTINLKEIVSTWSKVKLRRLSIK